MAWTGQPCDKSRRHGISYPRQDDRNVCGRVLGRLDCRSIHREDNIDPQAYEFFRHRSKPSALASHVPQLNGYVLPLDITETSEPFSDAFQQSWDGVIWRENADPIEPPRLLGRDGQRCGDKPGYQRYDIPPSHSFTSSVRAII